MQISRERFCRGIRDTSTALENGKMEIAGAVEDRGHGHDAHDETCAKRATMSAAAQLKPLWRMRPTGGDQWAAVRASSGAIRRHV